MMFEKCVALSALLLVAGCGGGGAGESSNAANSAATPNDPMSIIEAAVGDPGSLCDYMPPEFLSGFLRVDSVAACKEKAKTVKVPELIGDVSVTRDGTDWVAHVLLRGQDPFQADIHGDFCVDVTFTRVNLKWQMVNADMHVPDACR